MRSKGVDLGHPIQYKRQKVPLPRSRNQFSLNSLKTLSLSVVSFVNNKFFSSLCYLYFSLWVPVAAVHVLHRKQCSFEEFSKKLSHLLCFFFTASSLGLVLKSSTFSYLFTHQDIEGSQKKSLTLPLFVCYGFVVKQSMELCFNFYLSLSVARGQHL